MNEMQELKSLLASITKDPRRFTTEAETRSVPWGKLLWDRLNEAKSLLGTTPVRVALGDQYEDVEGKFRLAYTAAMLINVQYPRLHPPVPNNIKNGVISKLREVLPKGTAEPS